MQADDVAASIVESHVTKEEHALSGSTIGERLPYNDYTTIDWLHDLVGVVLECSVMTVSDRYLGQRLVSDPCRAPWEEPAEQAVRSI